MSSLQARLNAKILLITLLFSLENDAIRGLL